eukprot:SAG31_NODE_6502_length_1994_cov_1.297625_2_plen_176_part_00
MLYKMNSLRSTHLSRSFNCTSRARSLIRSAPKILSIDTSVCAQHSCSYTRQLLQQVKKVSKGWVFTMLVLCFFRQVKCMWHWFISLAHLPHPVASQWYVGTASRSAVDNCWCTMPFLRYAMPHVPLAEGGAMRHIVGRKHRLAWSEMETAPRRSRKRLRREVLSKRQLEARCLGC